MVHILLSSSVRVEASICIELLEDHFVIDEHQSRVIFLNECVSGGKNVLHRSDHKRYSNALTKQTGKHSVPAQFDRVLMVQRHHEVIQLCKRGLLTPTLVPTRLFTGFSNQVDVKMLAHHRVCGERLACPQ